MPDYAPIPRLDLPENWTPEGTICVSFPCPNDPQYTLMIAGLVDNLRWSKTFARDATETGAAIVARTWGKALDSQPYSIQFTQECGGMSYLLRQNPDDDCQLQQSIDGGENWTLAFDYGLCAANGPVITGEGQNDFWFEIIDFAGDIADVITPEIPNGPEAIALAILGIVQAIDPTYDDMEAIQRAAEQAYADGTVGAWGDTCEWREEYDRFWECNHKNTNLVDFLNNASQCMIDILNTLSDEMQKALGKIAAGLSQDAMLGLWNAGTPGDGAGFMEDCLWNVTLDFETAKHGFKPTVHTLPWVCPLATWISGTGWQEGAACTFPPGTSRVETAIYRALPATAQVTSIRFQPYYPSPSVGQWYGIVVNNGPLCQTANFTGDIIWNTDDFPLCEPVTTVRLFGNIDNWTSVLIKEAEFWGKGHNPFLAS